MTMMTNWVWNLKSIHRKKISCLSVYLFSYDVEIITVLIERVIQYIITIAIRILVVKGVML